MKKALIIVDYTNDFVKDDGRLTAGAVAQAIDVNIARAIEATVSIQGRIFVVNDLHFPGDHSHPESTLFPEHNIKGTMGREVYGLTGETLKKYAHLNDRFIFYLDKLRYSCFEGTCLDQILRQKAIDDIEIAGVCTDICVLHTAVEAYNRSYNVTIRENCVASFNPVGHEWALNHFENVLGFHVIRDNH